MDGLRRRQERSAWASLGTGGEAQRVSLSSFNSAAAAAAVVLRATDDQSEQAERRRVVGSPEYMCPEMLRGEGFDRSGDLWALGCILYEMIVGVTPFSAGTAHEVFDNVLNWRALLRDKPEYPPGLLELDPSIDPHSELVSDEAWDLITALLCERGQRLGESGMGAIAQHPWLQAHADAAPWQQLRSGNLDATEPPFVPDLSSQEDTSYFDAGATVLTTAAAATATATLEQVEEELASDDVPCSFYRSSAFASKGQFVGFTYKAFPTLRNATLSASFHHNR